MKKVLFPTLFLIILSIIVSGQADTISSGDAINSTGINWFILLSCFTGCIVQELIYWYEIRNKIADGSIPKPTNPKKYWIITIIAIVVFTFCGYMYFNFMEDNIADFLTMAVFSAGFPRLFKGMVSALKPPGQGIQREELPSGTIKDFSIMDYFI